MPGDIIFLNMCIMTENIMMYDSRETECDGQNVSSF